MSRPLHVIILNWNGARVIGPCLASLRKVTEPPLRIIVVDNASTDASPEIVRRDFPEALLIQNNSNLLFAAGNNVGIRRAMEEGARLILLLNNDTEVEPAFAARMADALERDPRAGIAGPKILYFDDPGRIWYGGGDFYPAIGIPRHRHIRRLEGTFEDASGQTGYVTGCALMMKREVVEAVGYLDPSFGMYCEDVDYCLRARRAGWRCLYEPSAVVRHKVSSSSGGGLTPYKLEHRIASTALLFRRHRPLWWRVLVAPLHAALFCALALGLLVTGRRSLLAAALRGAAAAAGLGRA